MKNCGLYKNVKMSLKTADVMVICAIALLVFCFVFAVNTAERTMETSEKESSVYEI